MYLLKANRKRPSGAIVGGAVGGTATLGAVLVALLFYLKFKQKPPPERQEIDPCPDPKSTTIHPDGLHHHRLPHSQESNSHQSLAAPRGNASFELYTQDAGNATIPAAHPAESPQDTTLSSTVKDTQKSPLPVYSTLMPPESSSLDRSPIVSASPEPRPSSSRDGYSLSNAGPSLHTNHSQLTAEQLVTLQTLYSLDLPTSEIASVMERMRIGQPAIPDNSSTGVIRGDGVKDPPRYELEDTP